MFTREIYTPNFIRLIFSNLFFWMSANLLGPTIPVHFHGLGYSAGAIGLIVGCYALGALLFRVPAGRWVDRYGSTRVLGIGIFFACLSLVLLLTAQSTEMLLLGRFIHGASITGFSSAALTLNSVMHPPKYQGEAVGIYTLFIMIGNGFAFSSSLPIYELFGFSAVATLSVLASALTFLLFPKNIKVPEPIGPQTPIPIIETSKNPGVWIPATCQFGSNFAYGALFTFVPVLFETVRASGLGWYYIAYSIAVVLTRMIVSQITSRIPSEKLLTWLLLGFGITLSLTLLPAGPFTAIVLGLLIGFTYGIAFPAMIPIVSSHTHLAERGTAFGLFTLTVDMGSAVGSILLGVLIGIWGFHWVFGGAALFLFVQAFLYHRYLAPRLAAAPKVSEEIIPEV